MDEKTHDLIVIGAGPGGYVAALKSAELGMDTACVDENDLLGGTCLRVGCIPSKALLESSHKLAELQSDLSVHGIHVKGVDVDLAAMLARKDSIVRTLAKGVDGLFRRAKITRYQGRARFDGPGRLIVTGGSTQPLLRARHYIIATGSRPASLRGIEFEGDRIGTSTEALSWSQVPDHLVVIGAGYIGLELGSLWRRLGARVTVLEALDRVLPGVDSEIAGLAHRILQHQGLTIRLGVRVKHAEVRGGRCVVELVGAEPVECERVLVAVGRTPNTDALGLETIGVQCDTLQRVPVDERFATSAHGVYAIGDCIGGMMLAHKASDEAVACVEMLAHGFAYLNYEAIPAVVYTHPEIAAVGKTEDQLQELRLEYRKGIYPFRANGRALTLGDSEGQVKVLSDAKTDRILGVHILGPHAGDLIAEAATAISFGASSEDLARCSHAHPTLAEALRDAALNVAGQVV